MGKDPRRRLPDKKAARILASNARGKRVDPVTLERAKATAADHYAEQANSAMRERDRRNRRLPGGPLPSGSGPYCTMINDINDCFLRIPPMSWGFVLFAAVYLLGMVTAVLVFTKPVRSIMDLGNQAGYTDRSTARESDVIVIATVTGIAMLWPLTLMGYGLRKRLMAAEHPRETGRADEYAARELVLAQRYGRPE